MKPTRRPPAKEQNILGHGIINAHTIVIEDEPQKGYEENQEIAGYYCDQVAEYRSLTEGDLIDPAVRFCEWCGRRLRRSEAVKAIEFGENPELAGQTWPAKG